VDSCVRDFQVQRGFHVTMSQNIRAENVVTITYLFVAQVWLRQWMIKLALIPLFW